MAVNDLSFPLLPPPPALGAPLPGAERHPDFLRLLAERRSTPALTLRAPGPDAETLSAILRVAARVPDHGKLSPWRFVAMGPVAKARIAGQLGPFCADCGLEPAKAEAALAKFQVPPCSVAVVFRPVIPHKIPVWEQELSAGAVCFNMMLAAYACGFGGNWLTEWFSYDARAGAAFGLADHERLAGVIHLGTVSDRPPERERPNLDELVTVLD